MNSTSPHERVKYWTVAPDAVQHMMNLNKYLNGSSIEAKVRDLVRLRVSQINGCDYCIDLHTRDAIRDGEQTVRLEALSSWRQTTHFTPREQAALAYAEAVTRVIESHVPDADYLEAARHFNEKELVDLTLVIAVMNAWNRMAISFRRPPQQTPIAENQAADKESRKGILSPEMKAAVKNIRLCYVATASLGGVPNVSPKASLTVLDDDHLAFANIASPRTMKNLAQNPQLEINTVDQISRRGFRFRGTAEIMESGPTFDLVANEIWTREGPNVPIHAVVKVHVTAASEVLSPAYWLNKGISVDEVRRAWAARYGYAILAT